MGSSNSVEETLQAEPRQAGPFGVDLSDLPPAAPRTLDWEKCAHLHNTILGMAWATLGENRKPRSWWDHYFGVRDAGSAPLMDDYNSATANELEERLPDALICFLKSAGHEYPQSNDDSHFFYYLKELCSPTTILASLKGEWEHCWEIKDRYICLYDNIYEGFVVLDIIEMKARQSDDYDHEYREVVLEEIGEGAATWPTFESMLEAFVDMVAQGRITALDKDPELPAQEHPQDDWIMNLQMDVPWYLETMHDEKVVDRAVSAWHDLLSVISSRLPTPAVMTEPQYYGKQCINECNVPGLFIRKFLRRIALPSFTYIAPGLRVPSPDELSKQPFKDKTHADFPKCPGIKWRKPRQFLYYPFILLRTGKMLSQEKNQPVSTDIILHGDPWQYSSTFEAGLYLLPSAAMERPDGCRLLLPYPLTPQKWVKYGSGDLLHKEDRFDGLYQGQRQSRGMRHYLLLGEPQDPCSEWCLRLELLLQNWKDMVEKGHWKVDADGVAGGIDMFKEADSEDKWDLYHVPKTW
ncbi:hypothetical protein BT63DRAFT_458396 [Microthyrium microscopicum]|uniref:Uncharacterized protein n=1 Tax=Microthyrium microscopicum TaxID=703497 RepID=A0A6A6U1P7_9PEZI|nr:hypothetical protein BT63DRAFT_458396 [Microthyrium microscopicum]